MEKTQRRYFHFVLFAVMILGSTFSILHSHASGIQLPVTGQTITFGVRDDGALQIGVAWPSPRFTDNSNGTVTDNLTGLVWLKNANCFGGKSWNDALAAANNLATGACGLTDASAAGQWRLPNINEFESIVTMNLVYPSLPAEHPFTEVQASENWSSTSYAKNTEVDAWFVDLSYGHVYNGSKTNERYVWPVRDGN